MKPIFIHYPKCSTCRKAAKWLKENNIDFDIRDIIDENPSKDELKSWSLNYSLLLPKVFNTSGIKYRELNLKSIVNTSTDDELIDILASDGKLVKRPVLVLEDNVLFGFNEEKWSEALDII